MARYRTVIVRVLSSVIGIVISLIAVNTVLVIIEGSRTFDYLPSGASVEARMNDYTMEDFASLYRFDLRSVSSALTADLDSFDPVQSSGVNQQIPSVETSQATQQSEKIDALEFPTLVHHNVNDNYIGRLAIPALEIEDSVYFTGDDFYLRRDYKGNSKTAGELYIDGRSSGNLFRLDNLINGHNMNNGTKFGKMSRMTRVEGPVYVFFKEYLTDRVFVYEIFSLNIVSNSDTGVHLYFGSNYARNTYYQRTVDQSLITTTLTDFENPILTLNTCDGTLPEGHLLAHAILIGWR